MSNSPRLPARPPASWRGLLLRPPSPWIPTARRRREAAEEFDTRVRLWREQSGAAALVGRNLPTDEALAAYASVNARTEQYKKSKVFPDASLDQIRAMAYLDLLNGITAADRIAHARAKATAEQSGAIPCTPTGPASKSPDRATDDIHDPASDDTPGDPAGGSCRERDSRHPDHEGPDGSAPDGHGPGGRGPNGGGSGGDAPGGGCPDGGGSGGHSPVGGSLHGRGRGGDDPALGGAARLTDLVVPLLTLAGLAERPGEGHVLGPLDPDLCRDLAATAANSPHSEWCVTITDEKGFAIAHGCARQGRDDKATRKNWPSHPGGSAASPVALPCRVNLTVPASALRSLDVNAPGWRFVPSDGRGMPGTGPPLRAASNSPVPGASRPPRSLLEDFGACLLTLPGGRRLTVKIEPVPTYECDHRHESHGYAANDMLRHLVQVRDGTCTFPPCSRHARETDFEHAVPYHKGGRTCACMRAHEAESVIE